MNDVSLAAVTGISLAPDLRVYFGRILSYDTGEHIVDCRQPAEPLKI